MQPLLGGPRSELTEAIVQAAINSPSPLIRHGCDVLDPISLDLTADTLPIDLDAGGEVRWAYRPDGAATAAAEIRRTATLNLAGDPDAVDEDLLLTRLFRPWIEMLSPLGDVWVRFHTGVFHSTLPRLSDDGQVTRWVLDLVPREHLWRLDELTTTETVAAATDVLDLIRAELAAAGVEQTARFSTPDEATTLGEPLQFPAGTPRLEKWRRCLLAIGYDDLVTDEDGIPTAQPLGPLADRAPEVTYGPGLGRVLLAGSRSPIDPEIPNTIRVVARQGPSLGSIEGNGLWVWTNYNDGPASLLRRGFRVYRTVQVDATTQTEIIVAGRAEAARLAAGGGVRWQGRVGMNPLHSDRDVIGLERPRLGIDSEVHNVTSWTLPLRRATGVDAVTMPVTSELRVEVAL